MGLITPYLDYVRPWINGTPDHNIHHDPAFEWLIEVDAETGQYKPWLAESWEMAQDGRSWSVKLHKGVQFHHGYGEFTAKDVVHTHALWCDENYPGRKDPPSSGYRDGICAVERIEVVNDHEIVMHCKVAVPGHAVLLLQRLERHDLQQGAVGQRRGDGVRDEAGGHRAVYLQGAAVEPLRPVRACPDTALEAWGGGLERTPDDLDTRGADAPRATVGGGNAPHRGQQGSRRQLVAKGYKLIRSRGRRSRSQINFGGLYFGTEDKATRRYTEDGGTTGKLDPKVPWTDKKVRQAMNKAINRDELLKVLYKGRAHPHVCAWLLPRPAGLGSHLGEALPGDVWL